MQFPSSWLRQWCNPAMDDAQMGAVLTMAGFELEDIQAVAAHFSGVVVGEIRECVQHPNADRLRVCQVDVGADALLGIVCGAPNARVGIRVPVAQVGALLPPAADGKPFAIKLGKLRGVESAGMLCSARELGIAHDADGLYELPQDAPLGQDIRQYLRLDENLLTLKLTPNLGHGLSILGLARELSAITGAPLVRPTIATMPATIADTLAVDIVDTDLCGRFCARVVRGVDANAKTPDWMVERLARCGQRSISALVDISNFVMFEYGQPSHIFDADKVAGNLQVRWATAGERAELLNGQQVSLSPDMGVIADGNSLVSLAGVMGGAHSAVQSETTRDIYLETAFWLPQAIAGRARRLNFSTDAAHRFERGVDSQLPPVAMDRLSELVLSICGGQLGPVTDVAPNVPAPKTLTMRVARAARVIGVDLSAQECMDALSRLDLSPELVDETITVRVPSYRFDLNIEADLIEEVVRIYGYEQLPLRAPQGGIRAQLQPQAQLGRFALRHRMAALGYQETICFSFIDEASELRIAGNSAPVRLLNPIASHLGVMRSSLMASLLAVLKSNIAQSRPEQVRIFEWGRVFLRDSSVQDSLSSVAGIAQPMHLGALAWGQAQPLQWGAAEKTLDFFDIKGDLAQLLGARMAECRFLPPSEGLPAHPALHPGRSACIHLGEARLGWVGELHPQWVQEYELPSAPLLFELDGEMLLQGGEVQAIATPSRFQAVQRDIALVLSQSIAYDRILQVVRDAQLPLLQEARLFDIYRPQVAREDFAIDEQSCAIRLSLWAKDAPLTEAEIEVTVQSLVERLSKELGAKLRK